MKVTKIGYIFISLGTIIILGYLIFAIYSFSSNQDGIVCKNMEINLVDKDKITLISRNEIARILESNELNPIGKTYKRVKTEAIEKQLMKNPMIKSVECYKTPSGTIDLIVKQRNPKFIIAGNESFYVDSDRKIIPVSLNYAAYLPVVSGTITHSMATGVIFDFVSYIESDPFWNAQIEQIYVSNDLNIELVPRVGETIISLGKLDNYQQKLENLHTLYTQAFNTIGWNKYKRIDLSYEDQIVCGKKAVDFQHKIFENIQKNDSIVKKL